MAMNVPSITLDDGTVIDDVSEAFPNINKQFILDAIQSDGGYHWQPIDVQVTEKTTNAAEHFMFIIATSLDTGKSKLKKWDVLEKKIVEDKKEASEIRKMKRHPEYLHGVIFDIIGEEKTLRQTYYVYDERFLNPRNGEMTDVMKSMVIMAFCNHTHISEENLLQWAVHRANEIRRQNKLVTDIAKKKYTNTFTDSIEPIVKNKLEVNTVPESDNSGGNTDGEEEC